MIKFHTKDDLKQFNDNHHPLYKKYITDYLNKMLSRFRCDDISEYGSIILLENLSDICQISAIWDECIEKGSAPVFVTRIELFEETEHKDISQVICKINGKVFAVHGEPEMIEPLVEQIFSDKKEGE